MFERRLHAPAIWAKANVAVAVVDLTLTCIRMALARSHLGKGDRDYRHRVGEVGPTHNREHVEEPQRNPFAGNILGFDSVAHLHVRPPWGCIVHADGPAGSN